VSKKTDDMMSDKEGSEDLPIPEPPPDRVSSSDLAASTPAPRAARFGEGPEGKAARRERDITGPSLGFVPRTVQFMHDVRAELKRVSWPSAHDVKNTTIIVVIAVIFFAIYLFVIDRTVAFLITQLDSLLRWLTGSG
jgi:preprotein translocase subunit SecE